LKHEPTNSIIDCFGGSLMSFTLLGILNVQATAAGGGGVSYWLSTLGGSSAEVPGGIAFDSTGNYYLAGSTQSAGSGDYDLLLAKYDSSGAVQWQQVLGGSAGDRGNAVGVDSNNNVYLVGYVGSASGGAGANDMFIAKYDSSGTIQWQRTLGGSASEFSGNSVAIDSADDIYIYGYSGSQGAGENSILLAKYNSVGTLQLQTMLDGSARDSGDAISVGSSGYLYALGHTESSGAGGWDFLIVKYDSSGAIQWQRTLGGSSDDTGVFLSLDSEENVYVTGYSRSAGTGLYSALVAKYNSSGVIQWQRTIGGASSVFGFGIATDSLGNVYSLAQGSGAGAGGNDIIVFKFDSSGATQWQRTLGGISQEFACSVALDASDNLYVYGRTASPADVSYDLLLAKLPNDGSLTGTYVLNGVDFTYAASSITVTASSLTAATGSLTAGASTLTSATSSLTDASASLTEHFVGIG
jgi:hypothetical protein